MAPFHFTRVNDCVRRPNALPLNRGARELRRRRRQRPLGGLSVDRNALEGGAR